MQPIPLYPLDSVDITILVDNVADFLLVDQGPAKRPGFHLNIPRVSASMMEGGQAMDVPLAQHGFSALVTLGRAEQTHRILFDTGATPDGVIKNMQLLGLSPKDIEVVVLSHGHFDHTTGLDGLVRTLGRVNMPVLIHPEFWNRRRLLIPNQDPFEIPTTSKSALQGVGFEIVEERQPSFLLDGSLLITGEVDRTTEFERGMPGQQAFRGGEWVADPLLLDDQALLLNIHNKGLVVLTGCGHAGIVNIVRYARKLTGIEQVYAIIGGFHLGGPYFERIIPQTCDALAAFAPEVIVPTHCTGFRAIRQLSEQLPEAFLQSSVGTTFHFTA